MSRAGLAALVVANLFVALQTLRHEWGYYETLLWTMCGRGSCSSRDSLSQYVFVGGDNVLGQEVKVSASPVGQGQHTFRAEIDPTSSLVKVSIDGTLAASFSFGSLKPPARSGMAFFIHYANGLSPTSVRITAFATALPPCPPSGDSILDSKAVRDGLIAGLSASGPNLPFLQRQEHGGIIYRLPDSTYFVSDIPNQLTGPAVTCGYALGPKNPPPGGIEVAIWHTHPHVPNDTAYNCNKADPVTSAVPYAVDPSPNGGGSDDDWNTTNTFGFPGYVISSLNEMVRLDTGVTKVQRKQNMNRWAIGSDSRACLTKSNKYVGL